jgi:hypothetical protein
VYSIPELLKRESDLDPDAVELAIELVDGIRAST